MGKKKREFVNRLNDLTPKQWIKFQKSWFVHSPPPRKKGVLRHPAKFPESLAQEFIEFFTKAGQWVLDPMVGTGSTCIAALRAGRNCVGIELNPTYAQITHERLEKSRSDLGDAVQSLEAEVFNHDATAFRELDLPTFDYMITSPPYWNMLHARGSQTQEERRQDSSLDVVYSDHPSDFGNIKDYRDFLNQLTEFYADLQSLFKPRAYLTIIVKNIKKGGRIYPLAWDLARNLSEVYTLKDEKIWCQDDIRLAPYGMGNAWVSNTFHHYCLQFRNEQPHVDI